MPKPDDPEYRPALLCPEAVALELSCGRTHVYTLLRRGELRSVQVGRLRRIPATEVDRYVKTLTDAQWGID